MRQVRITCPKCAEVLLVEYAAWRGHYAADEALAIQRAIKGHICKSALVVKHLNN